MTEGKEQWYELAAFWEKESNAGKLYGQGSINKDEQKASLKRLAENPDSYTLMLWPDPEATGRQPRWKVSFRKKRPKPDWSNQPKQKSDKSSQF